MTDNPTLTLSPRQTADFELQNVTGGKLADQVMAFAKTCEGQPSAIRAFRDRNRVSFQQFWANHRSDALDLRDELDAAEKKAMEMERIDLEASDLKAASA